MRILLFGGFLGSGKTSTILQAARQITEIRKETVVIIENEVGEAGVDDQLLAGSALQVRPLFGGCVCCQITSDLVTAVAEITDNYHPDWLIIEMTGLAVPGNVAKLVRQYDASRSPCKTVSIVDAGRWQELKEVLEPLILAQIKESDLVMINKIDLADLDKEIDLGQIEADVRQIAGPAATCLTVSAAKPLPLAVLEEVFHLE
ncbi:GTP-binding protein [Acetonema longum]|uniref:CobW-like protein n=1 Tax=Acetonema longum DSM 6540 TaxID=1009370 RepID=F7NLQ6_9FIRM|nr:GTP-binding protein [Acetonema longum]EGO62997.1 CobW-like protein [Acetonema longum DSM 6540]